MYLTYLLPFFMVAYCVLMSITTEQQQTETFTADPTTTITTTTTNEEEEPQQQQQQQEPTTTTTTTSAIQEYIKSLDQVYFTEIKENAKLKVFTVLFDGGIKKLYARRKVTMKEIAEIEKRREILRAGKGSALDKANALLDFYWFSAQCHLRETKTGKAMEKEEYENVTFEDFRKIIDACEFIMLYGVPQDNK